MRRIPMDVMEAAMIDGLGWFRAYLRVILPLARPAMATIAVLQFIQIWDDLLVGLLFLQDPNVRPITVGLADGLGLLDLASGESALSLVIGPAGQRRVLSFSALGDELQLEITEGTRVTHWRLEADALGAVTGGEYLRAPSGNQRAFVGSRNPEQVRAMFRSETDLADAVRLVYVTARSLARR
jgi:Binding-protein-dependent transport system inner membrane component